MNRCPICNDLMSRDQISDTVVLLQCPTCEHEEYELADTADLDTQPIAAIEKDEDTIITRPQPAERCPKCGQLMEDLPPVDEIDDPDWHYFMCTTCDTHRAYWWIDGHKVEGR